MKIEFIDSTVELTVHCLSILQSEGIDLADATKKLTENGQRIFLIRTPYFEQIALEKIEDNRFRFVLKQDRHIIPFTNYSAVFRLRNE